MSARDGVPRKIDLRGPWPTVFELDSGDAVVLRSASGATTVELIGVEHRLEPDYWTGASRGNQVHASAAVRLRVDGKPVVLQCRAGELPVDTGSVRLYVETTREWAHAPDAGALPDVRGDVRLSAVESGTSWGPGDFIFPIAGYRWRSSTYQNTWGALVPFNVYYHHRGEDLGAIPDRLEVEAALGGTVVSAPQSGNSDGSNGVVIDVGDSAETRYSHMNIGSIRDEVRKGLQLRRGEAFARTGATWQGKPQQHAGPHFHFDLRLQGTPISPYPTYIESYLRRYDDPALAVAGCHGFTEPAQPYVLDGTRSVARPDDPIVRYRWNLHDGRAALGEKCHVQYSTPGCYAEELVVTTANGHEARDAVMVYVYDRQNPKDIPHGWVHYAPARAIRPYTEVLFWNRLSKVEDTYVDFGDKSPYMRIGDQITHAYEKPGLYTVTVFGRGIRREHASVKLHVRVESPC